MVSLVNSAKHVRKKHTRRTHKASPRGCRMGGSSHLGPRVPRQVRAGRLCARPRAPRASAEQPGCTQSCGHVRGTVRGRGAGGGLALTFFTSRQTWWPWMERLYREAQEPTRSTTATDRAGVRACGPPCAEAAPSPQPRRAPYQKNGGENRFSPGGSGRTC